MFCGHCGKEVEENEKICTHCGGNLKGDYDMNIAEKDNDEPKHSMQESKTKINSISLEVLKNLDRRKKIIITVALVFILGMIAIAFGNRGSIVGRWEFVYCESEGGEYYETPEERKGETIAEIKFYKDGDFEAVIGEKYYSPYTKPYRDDWKYREETIRGEYEIEDDELILFYGYDDELRFEFEKKGRKLYLEDERRADYLYKKK